MSVTIPTFGRKPGTDVVFIINGGWYTYPAGSSQDVPIGVAELINNYYALHPEEEIPSGGGGGGTNQYIVGFGTTTPRMVYEAIQGGKSIVVQMTTSYEVTDTFPADGVASAYYNNISDVTPVVLSTFMDTETGINKYYLEHCNGNSIAQSYDPDEPFEEY